MIRGAPPPGPRLEGLLSVRRGPARSARLCLVVALSAGEEVDLVRDHLVLGAFGASSASHSE